MLLSDRPHVSHRLAALVLAAPAALAWLLVAFYPRPLLLARTLRHALRPDLDVDLVRGLAHSLPDDPELIRREVLASIMPYAYDWEVYGVPYYFPTLAEALREGRGDCKSQALVLAGILRAKGIDFRLLVSLDHIWVEYADKAPQPLEDPAVAVGEYKEGRLRFRRPETLHLRTHLGTSLAAYWGAAPPRRRLFLLAGAPLAAAVLRRALRSS